MKRNEIELDDDLAKKFGIRLYPGWVGPFTRHEAPEALFKNGARIMKAKSEPRDRVANGTYGTVLGSIYHPVVGVGYFVAWDLAPRVAVFVVGWKVAQQ